MSLTKEDLPTPALLLDLDIFQANLEKMAQHAHKHGKSLRPHAKTHKCVQVAQQQIGVGALGCVWQRFPKRRSWCRVMFTTCC